MLTHAEWFFRHHEQAGEALSHFTFRCSTQRQTMKRRVHVHISMYIYASAMGDLLHVSQLTERGRLRLLDALAWPRSLASSSVERSSPLQSWPCS